jgi:hypothetical protein
MYFRDGFKRRILKQPVIFLAVAALLRADFAYAEMRVWEDSAGKQVKAEFVRELFGSVELRRPDGSLHSIPVENLSALDIKYLRTRIPPEVELEVRTQKRAKERSGNATRAEFEQFSDEIYIVTATVRIRQTSSAEFDGILRAEVYLIGEEVATDHYRLSGKGASQVRFTEENKREYEFEVSADFRVYEEYNRLQTRGAEYAGYMVVVVDPMGNILNTQTDLSWIEGEDEINNLRKFHVDTFFDETIRKRSVPRPLYYDSRTEF